MSRTARAVAVVAAVCVLAQLRQLGLVSRVHTAQVADAPLPAPPDHGWVALEDAASGRTYYWHASTGRSEWSRPSEMGPEPAAATLSASTVPAGSSAATSDRAPARGAALWLPLSRTPKLLQLVQSTASAQTERRLVSTCGSR